jgi:hypothetical protein
MLKKSTHNPNSFPLYLYKEIIENITIDGVTLQEIEVFTTILFKTITIYTTDKIITINNNGDKTAMFGFNTFKDVKKINYDGIRMTIFTNDNIDIIWFDDSGSLDVEIINNRYYNKE